MWWLHFLLTNEVVSESFAITCTPNHTSKWQNSDYLLKFIYEIILFCTKSPQLKIFVVTLYREL